MSSPASMQSGIGFRALRVWDSRLFLLLILYKVEGVSNPQDWGFEVVFSCFDSVLPAARIDCRCQSVLVLSVSG
jgi:hypothetical protein